MQAIVTLVSAPAQAAVTGDLVASVGGSIDWLAPGIACDIMCETDDPLRRQAEIAAKLTDLPIDVAVLPVEGRRKSLLIADMDSTIITVECLDELADEAGLKPQIAAITESAMRGELDFEAALRARVALLAGLDEGALARTYEKRVRLTDGARTLVMTMRAHGARAELVSGGFTFFTARVATAAGFDCEHANQLEIENGKLTGKVIEPILGREGKLARLEAAAREFDLPLDRTLAVGDGANDLGMIQKAGLGVAFHAKPVVATAARVCVTHGDLTALLYFQGYRQADFHGE